MGGFPFHFTARMWSLSSSVRHIPVLFLLHPLLLLFSSHVAEARTLETEQIRPLNRSSSSVSAVFVFGDSTVDPGNNNYIETVAKSNFPPYGKDFPNQVPTGRFTNGRLVTDFLAKYVGIKEYVPPYLDPTLSIEELKSGVSFASAGSGFDPLTPTISNVVSLSEQLDHFKEYRAKLEAAIGKDKTKELINNALFLVSAGTNDFVVNYFTIPIRRYNYTIPSYMNFMLQEARQLLQALLGEGARRIGVVGLPPMGCLPVVITLYSDSPILKRDCISNFSSIGQDYNQMLKNELNSMQLQIQSSGARIAYIDIYGPLEAMTSGRKYESRASMIQYWRGIMCFARVEFEEVSTGCCGTGMLEASFMCNPKSAVCGDATKYVFWDSIHPTEKSYELLFQAFRPVIDALVKN
ncbi:UNVERIFIED_CONTAM: GDSL esterase/lipase [Sesamum angustifolium]|uniref:GDSL esterase/lipase n=1 Tax=Sesamum angustifolium TaxID=2727405 RepID=A0AAW2PAY7_9LAMI